MYIKYAILADSITSVDEGKTNIIGTFDRMYSSDFPVLIPRFSLFIKFEIDPKEEKKRYKFKLVFIDQNGVSKREPYEKTLTFPKRKKGATPNEPQVIINIKNMIIAEPGLYEFAIYIDGRYLYGVPLDVAQTTS